ncbi:hypothetical protein SAMN04515671_1459 [Nakamurella panacisegetis]|uniref:Uncharacterized protein n=1 Tax=Nakamurella panacisegetis TaxID=1090615 RepID=A0A1H0KX80_9ACTN|nr:hypothetical protein SAMN04515671_1459 [Nakamurella panacisegetis]
MAARTAPSDRTWTTTRSGIKTPARPPTARVRLTPPPNRASSLRIDDRSGIADRAPYDFTASRRRLCCAVFFGVVSARFGPVGPGPAWPGRPVPVAVAGAGGGRGVAAAITWSNPEGVTRHHQSEEGRLVDLLWMLVPGRGAPGRRRLRAGRARHEDAPSHPGTPVTLTTPLAGGKPDLTRGTPDQPEASRSRSPLARAAGRAMAARSSTSEPTSRTCSLALVSAV